jgi:hypothetical protein
MKPDRRREIVEALGELTDRQFVDFFYEAVEGRHIHETEAASVQAHLVLANAQRHREDNGGWSPWTLELLCPAPGEDWDDDAPICQFGQHCGVRTASWSKSSTCPICGGRVYGT